MDGTLADNGIRPGLAILDGKQTPIQKYRYLSNLRYSNVNLFYRLLANNVKVSRSQPVRKEHHVHVQAGIHTSYLHTHCG